MVGNTENAGYQHFFLSFPPALFHTVVKSKDSEVKGLLNCGRFENMKTVFV